MEPGTSLKRAVALKYKVSEDRAPKVIAKGQGLLAEKIIQIAKKNNIPIKEDKDLIEILSKIDVNREIPSELYKVVAEILIYVYKINNELMNYKAV
jgi:flagellar biosynthesis protein